MCSVLCTQCQGFILRFYNCITVYSVFACNMSKNCVHLADCSVTPSNLLGLFSVSFSRRTQRASRLTTFYNVACEARGFVWKRTCERARVRLAPFPSRICRPQARASKQNRQLRRPSIVRVLQNFRFIPWRNVISTSLYLSYLNLHNLNNLPKNLLPSSRKQLLVRNCT